MTDRCNSRPRADQSRSEPIRKVRRSALREPLAPGPEALAAAHSRILAALGREIAAELLKRP